MKLAHRVQRPATSSSTCIRPTIFRWHPSFAILATTPLPVWAEFQAQRSQELSRKDGHQKVSTDCEPTNTYPAQPIPFPTTRQGTFQFIRSQHRASHKRDYREPHESTSESNCKNITVLTQKTRQNQFRRNHNRNSRNFLQRNRNQKHTRVASGTFTHLPTKESTLPHSSMSLLRLLSSPSHFSFLFCFLHWKTSSPSISAVHQCFSPDFSLFTASDSISTL